MSLYKIRQKNPLIHCITNTVVTNFTANGLLAIGASPVMSDEPLDVEDMTSIADALLINIGTLNKNSVEAMFLAGKKANELNIPVVLDPVGAGATKYRKEVSENLLREIKFDLIRCNAGELAAIAGIDWQAKGVDSGEGEMDIVLVAKDTAKKFGTMVAVSGKEDVVTDGEWILFVRGGHEWMTQVTGTGCLLSAICAGALCLEGDRLENIRNVLADYKKVAEFASKEKYLGSFQVEIINGLHQISRGEL
ncbi:MAG: hydroxyethylthiazole kinase [Bacilli bacterium]|nr:hydroxyethylthiazole kinase [Bacilli bacterium]